MNRTHDQTPPSTKRARRQITFAQLQTLLAIAEAGSLVAAAEALNMTPAALTARVKGLEEAMGVSLFARLPAGLKLNAAGEAALAHVETIERAVRDMLEAMEDLRERARRPAVGRGGVDRQIFRAAADRRLRRRTSRSWS